MAHPYIHTSIIEETKVLRAGFEVHTAVFVKSYVCWDITPCSLLKAH
jgi:hypothetical protein